VLIGSTLPHEPCPQPFFLWLFLRYSLALCLSSRGELSSYISSPSSWDDGFMPPCPPTGFDGDRTNFLPRLALNHDPPDLQILSSLGLQAWITVFGLNLTLSKFILKAYLLFSYWMVFLNGFVFIWGRLVEFSFAFVYTTAVSISQFRLFERRPGWPCALEPPASAFWVLGLQQACVTMLSFQVKLFEI
jgi:hypothetical protein